MESSSVRGRCETNALSVGGNKDPHTNSSSANLLLGSVGVDSFGVDVHPIFAPAFLEAATPLIAEERNLRDSDCISPVEDIDEYGVHVVFTSGVKVVFLVENLKSIALIELPGVRHAG